MTFRLKRKPVIAITLIALLAPAVGTAVAHPIEKEVLRIGSLTTQNAATSAMPKNWKLWVRIGRCEQPGRGAWGVRWNHPGPTYQGGLGFWYGTWDSFKPRGYPDNAGSATWRQQMNAANRVARSVGFSAWGCYGRVR